MSACAALAFWMADAASPAAAAQLRLDSVKTGMSEPCDPVAFDIDGNGGCEILLSGADGRMAIFDFASLKQLWERQVSGKGLTAPVVGDFEGTGAWLIGVASSDGSVTILWPGNGETLARFDGGAAISTPPVVAPAVGRDGIPGDGLLVCDEAGGMRFLALKEGKLVEIFFVSNSFDEPASRNHPSHSISIGRITQPPAIGDINGDGRLEAVAGSVSGIIQVVPFDDPAKRFIWHGPQGMNISTGITLADFFARGRQDIAFGTDRGDLYILSCVSDDSGESLRVVRQTKLLGPANGHLLAADFGGSGYIDLVGASPNIITSFDAVAQMSNYPGLPFSTLSPPLSALSLVRMSGGGPAIVCGDARGEVFLVDPVRQTAIIRLMSPEPVHGFCPAGDLSGRGKLEIACLVKNKKRLAALRLDVTIDPGGLATMMRGVDFRCDGQWTTGTLERLREGQRRFAGALESVVGQARQALESGDAARARQLADRALAMSPANPAVRDIAARTHGRSRPFVYALVAILLAAASGIVIILKRRSRPRIFC
ncbi:MAG: hypothetical protein NTY46_07985 [Candidatus Sumerlaeota bacterium]|nr:hypothetical protein [Candidatus Sumerlaeota bacterium]